MNKIKFSIHISFERKDFFLTNTFSQPILIAFLLLNDDVVTFPLIKPKLFLLKLSSKRRCIQTDATINFFDL